MSPLALDGCRQGGKQPGNCAGIQVMTRLAYSFIYVFVYWIGSRTNGHKCAKQCRGAQRIAVHIALRCVSFRSNSISGGLEWD